MNPFDTFDISASGLTAQRQRLNVIAENLANANTTRTPEGGPYRRKHVVLETQPVDDFASLLDSPQKVAVSQVLHDKQPFQEEYDPGHPDADENGIVRLPNVNPVQEMVSLTLASRAFEANVAAIRSAKQMALKALEIGR